MFNCRLLLALALLMGLVAAPLAQAQAPGWAKVRVGVEGNYPPFSKMGADGKLAGFDIDIALALCARMKAADFSDSYYDVPSRWVAKAGAFKDHSAASFKGKKIIVLWNSPRAKHVADHYKDSSVLLVTQETDVYLELAAGRGDIGFGSSVVSADAYLKKPEGKGFAQVGPTVRLDGGGGGGGGGGGVGVAFRKGEDSLRLKVNEALKSIKADGSYKKLADKYFDFDVSGAS